MAKPVKPARTEPQKSGIAGFLTPAEMHTLGRLVLHSRPGDEALLVASARRLEHPAWDERGACWLDLGGAQTPGQDGTGQDSTGQDSTGQAGAQGGGQGSGGSQAAGGPKKAAALRQRLRLDETGRAVLPLPSIEAVLGGAEVLWLQALVAPAGESPNSSVAHWTPVFALRGDG